MKMKMAHPYLMINSLMKNNSLIIKVRTKKQTFPKNSRWKLPQCFQMMSNPNS